jgi:hypothetical protein
MSHEDDDKLCCFGASLCYLCITIIAGSILIGATFGVYGNVYTSVYEETCLITSATIQNQTVETGGGHWAVNETLSKNLKYSVIEWRAYFEVSFGDQKSRAAVTSWNDNGKEFET